MRNHFEFSVTLHKQVYQFRAVKQNWGPSHRYALNIEDAGVLFEPGNSGEYQAVFIPGQDKEARLIDPSLLKAIADELKKIDQAKA